MEGILEKYNKVILALNIVLLLVLLVVGVSRAGKSHSDFGDYYNASKLFYEKKDLYKVKLLKELRESIKPEEVFQKENLEKLQVLKGNVGTYIYPPLFAFLLIPLSVSFSYESASVFFIILNYLCLLGSIWISYRLLPSKFFVVGLLIALFTNYRFLENHVNNNQVAFLLIFLSLLSVYTKRAYISGFCLSLAVIIKLTPAIFVLYFLYKRRWDVLLYSGLFFLILLFLPSLYDHSYHIGALKDWNELVLQSAMKTPIFRAWKNNQSLVATLAKYFLVGADPMSQPSYSMPFINLSQSTVKVIFYLFSLSFVSTVFYGMYLKQSDNKIISLLFILSVILSGISWIHSFSVLLFPVLYFSISALENISKKKIRISLYIYCGLMLLSIRQIIGTGLENTLLMYSLFLYTSIYLYYSIYFLEENDYRDSQ